MNIVNLLAINFSKSDVKSGISLPDIESPNSDQTIKKPGTRYNLVLNNFAVRFNGSICPALPSIPENKEGENNVTETEKLTTELAKAISELQQQQKTDLSVELRDNKFEIELVNLLLNKIQFNHNPLVVSVKLFNLIIYIM